MAKAKDIINTAVTGAGAAAAGPVGAALGAGIGAILSGIFGGPKEGTATHGPHGRPWSDDDLPTETRAWWNDGIGGQFLSDYINSVDPRLFAATVDQLLPHYYAALMRSGRIPFWWLRDKTNTRDPRGYRPGLTEDAFRALGVDFAATEAAALAQPDPKLWRWVPIAGRDLNAEAAAEALRIKAKEASGAPLTPAEQAAADRLKDAETKKGGGTVLLILGGIVVAYFVFK